MEAGKLIVGVFSNMRRESRYGAGVTGFELGKGLEITLRRWICEFLDSKRLEGT